MDQSNGSNANYTPKKFIGGAERARRKAQRFFTTYNVEHENKKHKARHHKRNRQTSKSRASSNYIQRLPKKLKPSERFYGSLLQHDIEKILDSDNDDLSWRSFMEQTCEQALGLPIPKELPDTFRDANDYYTSLASLVIEESRAVLINTLKENLGYSTRASKNTALQSHGSIQKSNSRYYSNKSNGYMLDLTYLEQNEKSGFVTMNFAKPKRNQSLSWNRSFSPNTEKNNVDVVFEPFSSKELYDMKPGCVFKVTMYDFDSNDDHYQDQMHNDEYSISFLASVIPFNGKSLDRNDKSSILPLMMYNTTIKHFGIIFDSTKRKKWHVSPVTTLISEQRQFEACMKAPNICFMRKLLGVKTSTHIRFDSSDDKSSSSSSLDEDFAEEKKEHNPFMQSRPSDIEQENPLDLLFVLDRNGAKEDECFEEDQPMAIYCNKNVYICHHPILIPKLNKSQMKAAKNFLNSSSSTITLVQGPPGKVIVKNFLSLQYELMVLVY